VPAFTANSQVGPYTLTERIGAGGMGEVWKAHDTRLNRTVAIKRLAERHSARFEQEARAIAALNHPHICTLAHALFHAWRGDFDSAVASYRKVIEQRDMMAIPTIHMMQPEFRKHPGWPELARMMNLPEAAR